MNDSQLILPPKDIDLSQTFTDPLRSAQSSPVDQLKEIVTELATRQMDATQEAINQLDRKFTDKIDGLVPAINAELNALQSQLEEVREHNFYLETVLDSMIKLELLGPQMSPETRAQHTQVVATFLRNNALVAAAEHVETIQ